MKPGTSVETSDPFQPSADIQKATAFYVLSATELEDLSFADSANGPVIQKLSCTPVHPFFTPRGQIYAGDLRKGDTVCTRDGHGMVLVGKTERHGSFTVYNLTVNKDHTYYVGEAHGGIWVHNGNCFTRFGTEYETADDLAAQASNAEANGFPYGVSVIKNAGRSGSVASEEDITAEFNLIKTGRSAAHYTVELPNPVTAEVASIFNRIFGRLP